MIEFRKVSKTFEEICAVREVTMRVEDGSVFGLLGSNGAGKSTLLRMLAGILSPDQGEILVDETSVYENPAVKEQIFYISDDSYFLPNAAAEDMMAFYKQFYPNFDASRFHKLMKQFSLDENRKIATFSKGMRKQLSMILGISAGTRYLLCDETFDGLDPVMRQAVKSLIADEIIKHPFTAVIASHNLRELEDICDYVGLLHRGGILLFKELEDMKFHIHKVQCVLRDPVKEERLLKELETVKVNRQGSLLMITARGTRKEIMERVEASNPLFSEVIPLTLEEIFISETEVAGYEIKDLLF